jgi:CelD/BcsL family acetyltransferase involved in cellulose biosynthesis
VQVTLKAREDAFSQLADSTFRLAWENLYQKCPWATGFQSSRFVTVWYDIYRPQYTPVILSCFDSDGELVGLLALAYATSCKKLVGAGGPQAEYQVWIASTENSDEFMRRALEKLHSEFPGYSLHLKYIPSGAPLEALRSYRSFSRYCQLISYPRPYVLIDAETARKNLKNKGNRYRLNRLKRLGEVSFEKVTGSDRFAPLLDEYIRQYDFRQASMYGCPPFRNDPLKKQFVSMQFESGLLHATVMRVGDETVSIHLGAKDKKSVLTGMAHSPKFSSFSPGTLHTDMLCLELANEKIAFFDLTPGGSYKSRIASHSDEVFEVYSGNYLAIAGQSLGANYARTVGRKCIETLGLSPTVVRLALGRLRKKYLGSMQGWFQLFRRTRYCVYYGRVSSWMLPQSAPAPAKNSLDHLLSYDERTSSKTYQEFQHTAMRRLEIGRQVYTSTRDGILLFCVWVNASGELEQDFPITQKLQVPEKALVLYDFYVHPRARNDPACRVFLQEVLGDLARQFGAAETVMIISAGDMFTRKQAEQAGFGTSMIEIRDSGAARLVSTPHTWQE